MELRGSGVHVLTVLNAVDTVPSEEAGPHGTSARDESAGFFTALSVKDIRKLSIRHHYDG